MSRNALKFWLSGLGLVAIAVGVLFLADYIRYRSSPEYRAEQYFKDLERRYREDPYGGTTPEETLQLFIDALKKGNVELASKYFLVENQPEIKAKLIEAKENNPNNLTDIINRLESLKPRKREFDSAFFSIADEAGVIQYQVLLQKNSASKWKIADL